MSARKTHIWRFRLFGGGLLCDFCAADMPGTDPLFWGFPESFNWSAGMRQDDYERLQSLRPRIEMACPKCSNTLRKQEFIVRNARENHVTLPKEYWPYLD